MSAASARPAAKRAGARQRLGYDEAMRLARDEDARMRRRLARRADAQPEFLFYLAEDADHTVRREVAANPSTPPLANLHLAYDSDDEVRLQVARKLARLVPGLSAEEARRLGEVVTDTLMVLASDQLVRVREILAEELKATRHVAPAVIERLARDEAISVAVPVLSSSPLLSDDLLIEIIRGMPERPMLAAIARRAGLGGTVADALVAVDEDDVITALLENGSAQIREETLDALVERGADKQAWHRPLAERPHLSPRAILGLGEYVARALLGRLIDRSDIDRETAEALAATVRARLDLDADLGGDAATPESRAAALDAEGRLDETALARATETGDREFAIAALALKSRIAVPVVRKVLTLGSANGIVALVWKAGFSMDLAERMQHRLARIDPSQVLHGTEGGGFPLAPAEMAWQLALFA